MALTFSYTLGGSLLAWVLYLVGLAVYRLFFHPLARFPGPRFAALSRWHEFYYDVYCGGKFIFYIEKLHKIYGPIVRITPDEVHIFDSDYWETVFTKAGRVDKYEYMSDRFGNANSVLTTAPDQHHRVRRNALNPFFSRKRIIDLQSIIRRKLNVLVQKVAEAKSSSVPLTISRGFQALAEDVIMNYTFAHDYDSLNKPGWEPILHDSFTAVSVSGNLALQFPWFPKVMTALPQSWLAKLEPLYDLIFRMQNDFAQQIRDLKSGKIDQLAAKADHPTVFSELIKGDLPPEEKGDRRLQDEAQLLIGAGLATTGWTLSVGTYHILSNPSILRTLKAELHTAIPPASLTNPTESLEWTHLEKLPYLTAVIKEAVRLSHSTTSRNARIFAKPMSYKHWVIPARTPIEMTIPFLNHDETIFPDSYAFKPERWLDNPQTPNGHSLERYFVGFGKGSRSCLGVNLAWAELYLTFAALFRFCELRLYETDREDVALVHDYFLPFPRLDSKGVRVRVEGVDLE